MRVAISRFFDVLCFSNSQNGKHVYPNKSISIFLKNCSIIMLVVSLFRKDKIHKEQEEILIFLVSIAI
jgi:hypothetical protein